MTRNGFLIICLALAAFAAGALAAVAAADGDGPPDACGPVTYPGYPSYPGYPGPVSDCPVRVPPPAETTPAPPADPGTTPAPAAPAAQPPAPKPQPVRAAAAPKRVRASSTGTVTLGRLTCPVLARSCPAVSATLKTGRTVAGKATVTLRPGQAKSLRIPLSRAARRALKRHGRLTAKLSLKRGLGTKEVRSTVTILAPKRR
jgi:hypothetical protein